MYPKYNIIISEDYNFQGRRKLNLEGRMRMKSAQRRCIRTIHHSPVELIADDNYVSLRTQEKAAPDKNKGSSQFIM